MIKEILPLSEDLITISLIILDIIIFRIFTLSIPGQLLLIFLEYRGFLSANEETLRSESDLIPILNLEEVSRRGYLFLPLELFKIDAVPLLQLKFKIEWQAHLLSNDARYAFLLSIKKVILYSDI